MSRLIATGDGLKQEKTALSARPIEPRILDGIYLSIATSPLETVAMPHSAEALRDQVDDLIWTGHAFSEGKFFFISPSHLDAYLQLLDSLKQGRGLTLLIGERGIGKSTLLTKLIGETPPRIKLVLCNPTDADFASLLASIYERLGLSAPENTPASRIKTLHHYLNAPTVRIDSLVLLIEDAQHLPETVFEELFKLVLAEQNARRPLRVILSGSPRLTRALHKPKILRVLPADTLFLHLSPLDNAAIATYIYRQLGNAGSPAPEALFPASVIARIAHYARGLPQLINRLCEHLLETARKTGQFSFTAERVDQAASELNMDANPAVPLERKSSRLYPAMLAVLAGLIALLIGLPHLPAWSSFFSNSGTSAPATMPSPAADPAAGQPREPPPVTAPEATLPQVITTVPAALPATAPWVEPAAPDNEQPDSTLMAPDSARPTQAPGAPATTDPVDAVAAVPAAAPAAPQIEPAASGIKPTKAPEPNSAGPTRILGREPVANRSGRPSSVKPTPNRRTQSAVAPKPVVPAVQARKTAPPPRLKTGPSSAQYKSAAHRKPTTQPAPRSRSKVDTQDSTESNGWRIRK